jgi:hypothetical protein
MVMHQRDPMAVTVVAVTSLQIVCFLLVVLSQIWGNTYKFYRISTLECHQCIIGHTWWPLLLINRCFT